MQIIDVTPDKGLTPTAARAMYYCWMPCRISAYPAVSPLFWFLFALYPSSKLFILYKFVETLWREHRSEQYQELPETPPENLLTAFDEHWLKLSRWLYKKKWNKEHKLPRMEKEDKEALEREGQKWLYLLKLCQGLVGYQNEDKAVGLWGAALFEYKILNLKKLYNPDRYPPIKGNRRERKVKLADSRIPVNREDNGKRLIKKALQSELKALREGVNCVNSENQPWLRSIIQAALDVVKKETNSSEDFKKFFWEPYLSKCSEWANKFECKGINFLWAEHKEWYSRFPETKRGGRKIPFFEAGNYLEAEKFTLREFQELSHSLLYPPKNERLWMQDKLILPKSKRQQGYAIILEPDERT